MPGNDVKETSCQFSADSANSLATCDIVTSSFDHSRRSGHRASLHAYDESKNTPTALSEIHQPGVNNTNNDADYGFKDQPVKS